MKLAVPPNALAGHLSIVGKTGSGKTYVAKGIAEHLLSEERRVCVIDPTGAWWGLRALSDGGGSGYPVVIFGGEHADVPIAEDSAERLAELIAERNMPSVIDLSDFLIGERHRFMEVFAGTLYARNRAPLHLIVDEADEFAPQNPLPEMRRVLGHMDRIVRRGRIRGFRVTMITQRPAVLHKNLLTQSNTLIALRLTAPQDRKALEAWIKGQASIEEGAAIVDSLARLQTGEGWVWAPEFDLLERMKFPAISTFDSSRTPTEDDALLAPELTYVDAAELRALLTPKVAKAPSSGVNGQADGQGADTDAVQKAVQAAFKEGRSAGRREAAAEIERLKDIIKSSREAADRLIAALGDLGLAGASPGEASSVSAVAQQETLPSLPEEAAAEPQEHNGSADPAAGEQRPAKPSTSTSMGEGAEMRLLRILAQWNPRRLTRQQLATLAGISYRGGTFSTYLSRLRRSGFLDEGNADLTASAAGLAAVGNVGPTPKTGEIREIWVGQLGPRAAGRMVRILADRGEQWSTRKQLAGWLSMAPNGGTFSTYLSRLRRNGLLEERKNSLRLADILREERR